MRSIYVSLMLLLTAPLALADWVAINNSTNYYYDPSTFTSQGKYAKVWGIVNYDEPIQNGQPKSKKIFLESDCHEGQVKTLTFSFHSERQGKGDLLAEGSNSFSAWRLVKPQSLDEILFNISCRSSKKDSSLSPDFTQEDSLDEDEVIDEVDSN